MTETILWEGHGLEVRRLTGVAYSSDGPWQRGMPHRIVLAEHRPGTAWRDIATTCSVTRMTAIMNNPERWVRKILRQRLRTAMSRVIRCLLKRDAAREGGDRWAEIAMRCFGLVELVEMNR